MPLRCDTRLEKGGKKSLAKGRIEPGSIASKDGDTQFTICTTGVDVLIDTAVLVLVLPVHLV